MSGHRRMKFDRREWVNDIATGTLAGLAAGAFGAAMLPDTPMKLVYRRRLSNRWTRRSESD